MMYDSESDDSSSGYEDFRIEVLGLSFIKTSSAESSRSRISQVSKRSRKNNRAPSKMNKKLSVIFPDFTPVSQAISFNENSDDAIDLARISEEDRR